MVVKPISWIPEGRASLTCPCFKDLPVLAFNVTIELSCSDNSNLLHRHHLTR